MYRIYKRSGSESFHLKFIKFYNNKLRQPQLDTKSAHRFLKPTPPVPMVIVGEQSVFMLSLLTSVSLGPCCHFDLVTRTGESPVSQPTCWRSVKLAENFRGCETMVKSNLNHLKYRGCENFYFGLLDFKKRLSRVKTVLKHLQTTPNF